MIDSKVAIIKLQNLMTHTLTMITKLERQHKTNPDYKLRASIKEWRDRYEALKLAVSSIKECYPD